MSTHNLGMFSYEEKLNENGNDYHSNQEDDTTDSEISDYEFHEQEELARTQQLHLQERLLILQRTLNNLRSQVREEREMWKREVDEISSYCNGKCYEASGDLGARVSQDNFRNSAVSLDLESKASYASDSYNERKIALQRQIAYSNFQRRLLEVENMCNLELLRVKQSAQFLEPLRIMVSEWNKDGESSGDGEHIYTNSINVEDKETKDDIKKPKEASDAIELIGSKLYNEINEMFNKVAPGTWKTSSEESTFSNGSSTGGTYISDAS